MNYKVPYKLEVWEDQYIYDKNSSIGHWEEIRSVMLGANDMDFAGRAYNIGFKEEISGKLTLTFSMDSQFYDNHGELIKNYLIDYVFNGVKVKLNYNNEWYDFVVKQVKETHNQKLTLQFTCEQLATYELGKIGYEVTFSMDDTQGSAIQEAHKFIEETLKDTEWEYIAAGTPGSIVEDKYVDLTEFLEEVTYFYEVTTPINLYEYQIINGILSYSFLKRVSSGYLLIPYSQVNKKEGKIFVYYSETKDFSNIDEDVIDRKYLLMTDVIENIGAVAPTLYNAKVPQRSLFNEYIYYTNYDKPYNNITQYCNKFAYVLNNEKKYGYYRQITKNLDYGYEKTVDPYPSNRCFAETSRLTNLVSKPLYFTYEGTDKEERLRYLKIDPDFTWKEGDTFDIYYNPLEGRYKLIVNEFDEAHPEAYVLEIVEGFPSGAEVYSPVRKTYYIKTFTYDGNVIYTPFNNLGTFDYKDYTHDDWYNCTLTMKNTENIAEQVRTVMQYFEPERDEVGNITNINILGYGEVGKTYFYIEDENGGYSFNAETGEYLTATDSDEVKYSRLDIEDIYSYNMYRTVEVKESNCFNIIEEVAETFEVWPRYIIEHEPDGRIAIDENGRRKKWVTLVSEYGRENEVGLTYGFNTSSIVRDVNSNKVATKIFVKDQESKAAPNGIVAIQYADNNISREGFVLNFSYFIQNGLIDGAELSKDLYNIELYPEAFNMLEENNNYIEGNINGPGYLRHLGLLNSRYDLISDTMLGGGEDSLSNQLVTYKAMYDAYAIACATDGDYALSGNEEMDITERKKMDIAARDSYKVLIEQLQAKIDDYNRQLNEIKNRKRQLHLAFNKKYQRFIQEGHWSEDNYSDCNKYYNDALKVSVNNAVPTIKYTVKIVDLRAIPGYEMYQFNVGDQTWIEDLAYFGRTSSGRPYHEKITIKEINYANLDDPTKTTITITNRSNRFKDVFQKLSATVQSYSFNEAKYERVSAISPSGALQYSSLQDSFKQNKNLTFVNNDVVVSDNTGITVKNASNPDDIVRIVSGGIVLSNDGGKTYKTGIYGGQINTELLKAGTINTEKLHIGTSNTEAGESIYFEGDTITAIDSLNKTIIKPNGITIQKKVASGSGYSTLMQLDKEGDLILSGSIVGGENTKETAPNYYIGLKDINRECAVGPEYVMTTDKTPQASKEYYTMSSGYMNLQEAKNHSKDTTYIFDIQTYRRISTFKPTADRTPVANKTYYYPSYVIADINPEIGFEEYITYYFKDERNQYVETSEYIYGNTYYEKQYQTVEFNYLAYELSKTEYLPVVLINNKKQSEYYKRYTNYKRYTGISFSSTGIYYEKTTNERKKDWRILLGSDPNTHNFGVDSNGYLYTANATFSGNVYADGGVFNNVTIKGNCDIAGEAITGTINDNVTVANAQKLQGYVPTQITYKDGDGKNQTGWILKKA